MPYYLLKRIARGAFTLLFVVTLVFVVGRLGADPTLHLLSDDASEIERQHLREIMGLDRSIPEQYVSYLAGLAVGDFGTSYYFRRPVAPLFLEAIPNTIQVTGTAFLVSTIFGILLGVLCANWHGSAFDRTVMAAAALVHAIPNYVIGIAFILLFSLVLRWLPSGGSGTIWHMVMPVATIAMSSAASLARYARSALLEVLRKDYLRTARAKGLHPQNVLTKHALRNAGLPIVTWLGMRIGGLISGTVIIETVFAWPGVGRLIVTAVTRADYPVIQIAIVGVAASIIMANIIADLTYSLIDPRVKITGN